MNIDNKKCENSNLIESSSQESTKKNLIIGSWSGTLDIGIAQMTIVLHIEKRSMRF